MSVSKIGQVLEDYQRLRSQPLWRSLPAMRSGGMSLRTDAYETHEALWNALRATKPLSGWLLFQSYQQAFDGELPTPQPKWGRLLQAEAATQDGRSITVSRPPRAGWRVVATEHQITGDLLWDECRHLAYDPKLGVLRYRRYWRDHPELGLIQVAACFFGFSQEV